MNTSNLDDPRLYEFEKSRNYVTELLTGRAEETVKESSLDPDSFFKPFNPDDLYQKAGDYTLYEDMTQDDQVSVALQLKKDLVLGAGFEFFNEDPENQEIADALHMMFTEDVDRPFDQQLEEILTSYEYGFSLSEKLFKKMPDGMIALSDLKTRHPNTWLIEQDEKGNILEFVQRGSKKDISVKPKKMIHFVNKTQFQNPFGRSDLRPAYEAWFVKRHIVRYYSIYLEKAASPTPVGRYDKSAPQTAVTKIFDALKALQTKTTLVIPKDIEVDFLEAKTSGEVYIKGINLFNMFIARSILIPDLLGLSGSETGGGSFALGKEQLRIFFRHIQRRRMALEYTINHHIIKPLVFTNWGEIENWPRFRLKDISGDEVQEFAKIWVDAVRANVYKPSDEEINHFRSLVNFPEGEVERKEEPQQVPVPGMPPQDAGVENEEGGIPEAPEEESSEVPDPAIETELEEDVEKMRIENAQSLPGEFDKKTDFKSLKTLMEGTESKIVAKLKPLTDEIVSDIIEQVEKKKFLEKKTLPEELKFKKASSMRRILNKELREEYDSSRIQANNELGPRKFAEPLLDKEFLRFLEDENFEFIEKYKFNMSQDVRNELRKAIKDGTPLNEVKGILSNKGKKLSQAAIERYARTKSTEVLNRARMEVFNENEFVESVQFSAITDDRTTDICNGLHGKIFEKSQAPIPPLHFNCRSALVPITQFEPHTVDTRVGGKTIDKFIDDNIGEGFSKK